MSLFIEILSGPLQGEKHPLKPGFTIGRREGDLILDDGKVSSLHAKVEVDNKGQSVLVDQGSANGLVLDQRKVRRIALLAGLTFRVGDTLMSVLSLTSEQVGALAPVSHWQDRVEKNLATTPSKNRPLGDSGLPFSPAVRLEFIQGVQADESVVLGYGPRVAGRAHLDISLKDPSLPSVAFELRPGPGAAFLHDHSAGKLLINDEAPKSGQALQDGDVLVLGMTHIKVRYI